MPIDWTQLALGAFGLLGGGGGLVAMAASRKKANAEASQIQIEAIGQHWEKVFATSASQVAALVEQNKSLSEENKVLRADRMRLERSTANWEDLHARADRDISALKSEVARLQGTLSAQADQLRQYRGDAERYYAEVLRLSAQLAERQPRPSISTEDLPQVGDTTGPLRPVRK